MPDELGEPRAEGSCRRSIVVWIDGRPGRNPVRQADWLLLHEAVVHKAIRRFGTPLAHNGASINIDYSIVVKEADVCPASDRERRIGHPKPGEDAVQRPVVVANSLWLSVWTSEH